VLSIDIGGSKIMAGVIDTKGRVYHKVGEALGYPVTEEALLGAIARLGHDVMRSYSGGNIVCTGATVPGLADAQRGVWEYSSFSGIRNLPLAEKLSKEFGTEVYIENDVNACAMAEIRFGACADVKNFVWVTISNGIGGSVVANGKVYAGEYGNAGEIGHICVSEGGYQCKCGSLGCAEACAAGPAILRRYLERTGRTDDAAELSAKTIADKARQGEADAIKVYEDTGYYLGKALAAVVNILNPQKIILGGGVSISMDLFYPQMKKTLDSMIFRDANRNLVIEKTALGYDAALFGAAAIGFAGHAKRAVPAGNDLGS